jgi:hypothetical protein
LYICQCTKLEEAFLLLGGMVAFRLITTTYIITVSVLLSSKDGPPWWLTGVYGPQHDADKVAFFEDLREVRENCPGPWMLAGDFNTIY